jgi:indolepyruvate ferredoxin oxidoreductase beta subunit
MTTSAPARLAASDKPVSIAILAMGGQGGGVLSDWIVAMAEAEGWIAQATSVPGVAQRTGATIYYIELMPGGAAHEPVLALMPTPGDVDIVMAAEFMEAGRSVLRGLVTPDRTTLIASTHRSYAVAEKEKPGDGRGSSLSVVEAAEIAARRTIAFDMLAIAERNATVISAALFGALAGAGALPFADTAFEAAIAMGGGRGAQASLAAFREARQVAAAPAAIAETVAQGDDAAIPVSAGHPALDDLLRRLRMLPEPAQAMAYAGIKRLVSFQDVAYAGAYLDRLAELARLDGAHGGAARQFAFTTEAAKYLAVAMSYDDLIRVADLKTRASRFARVRDEVAVGDGQVLHVTEYMHPRMEEVIGALPWRAGEWLERQRGLVVALDRVVNRGRRVRTNTLFWFVGLYVLGGLKPLRRGMLRHHREQAHIESWLGRAVAALGDYDLAVEVVRCRRLVKGYSDTHARSEGKFAKVVGALDLLTGKPDAAAWLRRLRQAALADEDGVALDGALRTMATAWSETEPS